MLISAVLPAVLWRALPELIDADTAIARVELLLKLQLLPALVVAFCVIVTGAQRIPSSFVAAHDPAAAYYTNMMPMNVIAGKRAFINTLEQYALLFCASAALVLRIPFAYIGLLPAWYGTCAICRVLYVVGYVRDGNSRMLGFPGTFLPSLAGLGWACYLSLASK